MRRRRNEAEVSGVSCDHFQMSIPRREKAFAVDDVASVLTDAASDSELVDDDAPSLLHYAGRHL